MGFDAAWELDFWGKYRRGVNPRRPCCSRRWPTTIGAGFADGGGGAHVCRDPHLRGADRAGRGQRQVQEEALGHRRSPGSRTARPRSWTRPRRPTLLESTRATIPPLQVGLQQARNALSTLLGAADGAVEPLLAGPRRSRRRPRRWRSAFPPSAAAASGHPQRRADGRGAVRPHRRRQGRPLSQLFPASGRSACVLSTRDRARTTSSRPAASSIPPAPASTGRSSTTGG